MIDPFYQPASRPSSMASFGARAAFLPSCVGLLRDSFKVVTGPVTLRCSNKSHPIWDRESGKRALELRRIERRIQSMTAIDVIGGVGTSFDRRVRCCVCGFSEVRTDEALDRGVIFLAECPRCEHRWTSQEPIASDSTATPSLATARFQRVSARLSREVQPAA